MELFMGTLGENHTCGLILYILTFVWAIDNGEQIFIRWYLIFGKVRRWIDLLQSNRYGGFPHRSVSKESACNAGDLGSIPGLRRSPGEGNGNPLQYSCLEKSHGQKSLVGYSPWGHKSQTRLRDQTTTTTWLKQNANRY